eukprot:682599_1
MCCLSNIHKSWKNFGTYGHSKLISLVVLIGLHLAFKVAHMFYTFMDCIPCVYHNDRHISSELRAFQSVVYPTRALFLQKSWPILDNSLFCFDVIFLSILNFITNYGLGSGVPTAMSTNITKHILYKTQFIASCQDRLHTKYNISLTNTSGDYTQCMAHDVEYLWISGDDTIAKDDTKLIVYVHGGGYSLGGPSHVGYVSHISLCTNTKVLFVCYAKPPIADIPYQVDQLLTVYLYLLLHLQMDHKRIVFCGDSAGGGLITLFIQKLSLLKLSHLHPLGIILSSPWVDLTMDAKSWITCQFHDAILHKTYVSRSGLIAVGNDTRNLRSPFFSAIYAPKYKVECNVMIFVSKHECLYDDAKRLVQVLRENNVFSNEKADDNCTQSESNDDQESKCTQTMHDDDKTTRTISTDASDSAESENKELIYHEVAYMPHAFLILYSLFPEANHAMDQVSETLVRWFKEGDITTQ